MSKERCDKSDFPSRDVELPIAEPGWLTDRLAVLPEVGCVLCQQDDPSDVLREAVRLARELLGFSRIGIWLLEPNGASASGSWGVNLNGEISDERGLRIFDNSGFIRRMREQWLRAPHYYAKALSKLYDGDSKYLGVGPHVTAPFFCGEKIDGFVAIDGLKDPSQFNRDTGLLLLQFGQQISCAYQRAKMIHKLGEERARREAAERMKSEFLGMFGHEVRTPLNAMVGYSQLIASRIGIDPEIADLADTITDCGGHLSELVESIMTFAQLSESDVKRWENPADPIDVIESTIKGFGPSYAEKGLQLRFVREGKRSEVMLDSVSFRQILTNLLQNALKFTDAGSVTVRAMSRDFGKEFVDYLISVSDTGVGIDPMQLDEIFEPFRQVDDKKKIRGSIGIGLAVVKKIVEHMGGSIRCDSVLGEGSTFSISVRFERPPVAEADPGGPMEVKEDAPDSSRILIVDDNEANRDLLCAMAKCLGYANTDIASDGEEARGFLEERMYDLVMMDLHMPRLDGLSLTRLVRNGHTCPLNTWVPIVGVTAYTSRHDREECLLAGMTDYLEKPVDMGEVRRVLTQS